MRVRDRGVGEGVGGAKAGLGGVNAEVEGESGPDRGVATSRSDAATGRSLVPSSIGSAGQISSGEGSFGLTVLGLTVLGLRGFLTADLSEDNDWGRNGGGVGMRRSPGGHTAPRPDEAGMIVRVLWSVPIKRAVAAGEQNDQPMQWS